MLKYVLAISVLLTTVGEVVADEYKVTGVLCRKEEDLVNAIHHVNTTIGSFLPDVIAEIDDCMIIMEHPVLIHDVKFLKSVPAIVVQLGIYRGIASVNITKDSGELIPESTGEWFFTPTAKSGLPLSRSTQPTKRT